MILIVVVFLSSSLKKLQRKILWWGSASLYNTRGWVEHTTLVAGPFGNIRRVADAVVAVLVDDGSNANNGCNAQTLVAVSPLPSPFRSFPHSHRIPLLVYLFAVVRSALMVGLEAAIAGTRLSSFSARIHFLHLGLIFT